MFLGEQKNTQEKQQDKTVKILFLLLFHFGIILFEELQYSISVRFLSHSRTLERLTVTQVCL